MRRGAFAPRLYFCLPFRIIISAKSPDKGVVPMEGDTAVGRLATGLMKEIEAGIASVNDRLFKAADPVDFVDNMLMWKRFSIEKCSAEQMVRRIEEGPFRELIQFDDALHNMRARAEVHEDCLFEIIAPTTLDLGFPRGATYIDMDKRVHQDLRRANFVPPCAAMKLLCDSWEFPDSLPREEFSKRAPKLIVRTNPLFNAQDDSGTELILVFHMNHKDEMVVDLDDYARTDYAPQDMHALVRIPEVPQG